MREPINGELPQARPISRKDNTKEFDSDLTIADWLTQYSEIKDDVCPWFPGPYAVCR